MLARPNRVIRAGGLTSRSCAGVAALRRRTAVVLPRSSASDASPARFGFIVAQAVGGAVDRNRVRRRLQAVGREIVDAGGRGHRTSSSGHSRGAAQLGWASLRAEMHARASTPAG